MDDSAASTKTQAESIKGACPYCLADLDVHFDVKGRPYWRCWRCEVRSFGTKTAYVRLTTGGWIWRGARPVATVREWLDRVGRSLGLSADRSEP